MAVGFAKGCIVNFLHIGKDTVRIKRKELILLSGLSRGELFVLADNLVIIGREPMVGKVL